MSAASKNKVKNPSTSKKKECGNNLTEDQSSDTMTFPFNLCDCTGEIERYFSEDGGLIVCIIKRQKRSVIFFRDCIFVNGCSAYHVVNLQDVLKTGTTVSFDAKKVCLDIGDNTQATCKVYQASLVWIGSKPRLDKSLNIKKVDYLHRLSCIMNVTYCKSDPDLQSVYSPAYLTHLHVSSYKDKRDVLKIGERFKVDLSGRVLGYISETEGILLCEISGIPQGVLFNVDNLYLNERKCTSEKRLASYVKYNAELFCNAIKLEKQHTTGVTYQASCVWNSVKPTVSVLFEKFLKSPAEPAVKLRTDTIYDGVVMKISPPSMALVIVEGKNKVIPVLLFSKHFCLERDGQTLSEDSFIADYVDEFSVLELKIESFKGRFSANKIQNISKAWTSDKSINKLGNCIKQYICHVGGSTCTVLTPACDSKKLLKNVVKIFKNHDSLYHMSELLLQKANLKLSADFKSSGDSSDTSDKCLTNVSDIKNDRLRKSIKKYNKPKENVSGGNTEAVYGSTDRSTSQSPVSSLPDELPQVNDIDSLEMPITLKGISGKILYISDVAGIVECNIHKKNIKLVFHRNVVRFSSNSKPNSLEEYLPVGKIVQLDMKKIHWCLVSNTPTYRVTSLWVGKRPKKSVKAETSTLIPNQIYKAKVTECRPPLAFISEIIEGDTKYVVFVFNFVLRIQNRMLKKNESIAPHIQVDDEVNLIVKRNENLCDDFVWEATEAWKANENVPLSSEVIKLCKGKLVRVKKDQGTLECEQEVLRPFYRRNAYLLGLPLKNFNLTDVLVKGDTVSYEYIKEGDEQNLKVWIGMPHENHQLEDKEVILLNVINYCVTRDISLPVIQKLTEELENLHFAINLEKKEIIRASKNLAATVTKLPDEDSVENSSYEEDNLSTSDSYCGGDVYMSDEEVVNYGEICAAWLDNKDEKLTSGVEVAESINCTSSISEGVNGTCIVEQVDETCSFEQANGFVKQVNGPVKQVYGSVKQINGPVKQANGSVKQVNDSVEQVSGSVKQANGSIEQANGSVEQANRSVKQVNGPVEQANGCGKQANGSVEQTNDYVEQANEAYTIKQVKGPFKEVDSAGIDQKISGVCTVQELLTNDIKCNDDSVLDNVVITETTQTELPLVIELTMTESPAKVNIPELKVCLLGSKSEAMKMARDTLNKLQKTVSQNVEAKVKEEEESNSICSTAPAVNSCEMNFKQSDVPIQETKVDNGCGTVVNTDVSQGVENKNTTEENTSVNEVAIDLRKAEVDISASNSDSSADVSTDLPVTNDDILDTKIENEADVSLDQALATKNVCEAAVVTDSLQTDTEHPVDATSEKEAQMESNNISLPETGAHMNSPKSITLSSNKNVFTESCNGSSNSNSVDTAGIADVCKRVTGDTLPEVEISSPKEETNKASHSENLMHLHEEVSLSESKTVGSAESEFGNTLSKVDCVLVCPTNLIPSPNNIQEQMSQTNLNSSQNGIQEQTSQNLLAVNGSIKSEDESDFQSAIGSSDDRSGSDIVDVLEEGDTMSVDSSLSQNLQSETSDEDEQVASSHSHTLNIGVDPVTCNEDIRSGVQSTGVSTPGTFILHNSVLNIDFEEVLKKEMLAKCSNSTDKLEEQMKHLNEKVKNFCFEYLNEMCAKENVFVMEHNELATPMPESKETVDCAVQTLSTGDIMYCKILPS